MVLLQTSYNVTLKAIQSLRDLARALQNLNLRACWLEVLRIGTAHRLEMGPRSAVVSEHGNASLIMLREGHFSDFQIETSTCTFLVHKSVLFTQSGYFQRLLLGDNLETQQSKVKFDDISPSLIARIILYSYDPSSYPASISASAFAMTATTAAPRQDTASINTATDAARCPGNFNSSYSTSTPALADEFSEISPHNKFLIASDATQLYSVADRFAMPTLKRETTERFIKAWRAIDNQSGDDYGELDRTGTLLTFSEIYMTLVRGVYAATPPADRMLKDVVVRSIKHEFNHDNHFKGKYGFLRQLVEEVDDLAADLLFWNVSQCRYRCGKCGELGRHVKRPCGCERRELWCDEEKCRKVRRERSFCMYCGTLGTLDPVRGEKESK